MTFEQFCKNKIAINRCWWAEHGVKEALDEYIGMMGTITEEDMDYLEDIGQCDLLAEFGFEV